MIWESKASCVSWALSDDAHSRAEAEHLQRAGKGESSARPNTAAI